MRTAGSNSPPDSGLDAETRPWIVLKSQPEIEAWIDRLDHELQQLEHARAGNAVSGRSRGHGVALRLTHGGEISLHTTADGSLLLELSSDADWVAPLIVAATGAQTPRGAIWMIPGDRLTELIMGLNSLIESERLMLQHRFRGHI